MLSLLIPNIRFDKVFQQASDIAFIIDRVRKIQQIIVSLALDNYLRVGNHVGDRRQVMFFNIACEKVALLDDV